MTTPAYSPGYLAEDSSGLLLRTCIAFLVLETTFMILFYVSRYMGHQTKEEGSLWVTILMTSTYATCISKLVICIVLIPYGGIGRHSVAFGMPIKILSTKLGMVLNIVCPLTTSLSKLGLLCLYYRIFGHISRTYRLAIATTFMLVVGTIVGEILISVLNCYPYSWNWYPRGSLTCKIPVITVFRFKDLPNLITTFIIAAIPILGLIRLRHRFSRPVRIGLVLVLCLCFCAIVAAIMRFRSYYKLRTFQDFSYEKVTPLSWAIAESGLYLIASTSVTLRPLLTRLFKDTIIHRFINESDSEASATFWSDKSSRRWFKSKQPYSKEEKDSSSVSDGSREGVEYMSAELHKHDGNEKCQ